MDTERHTSPHDGPREHNHEFNIIVNGRPRRVPNAVLSYDELVALAFNGQPPTGPYVVITITYRHGHEHGTVAQGESVSTQNGMVFNVTATDRS